MSAFEAANIRARRRASEHPAHATRAFEKALAEVQASSRPAALNALKLVYQSRGLTPAGLRDLTGIPLERIRKLSNASIIEEPWLDEAYLLHRALCTNGIAQLMNASGTLTDSPMGIPLDNDLDVFRSGLRLPLSTACRLTLRFGLDDPAQLMIEPLHMQIWSVVSTNERNAPAGSCPWCLADIASGEPHLPTCLPNNLWGDPDPSLADKLAHKPRPRGAGDRQTFSDRGRGLKTLREAKGRSQAQVAKDIGVAMNHYARMERGEVSVTLKNAEKLAALFGVEVAEIYK